MEKVKLTGLWKNTDKSGRIYLSGRMNAITTLMILPNTFKKDGDKKSPDYFVYLSPSKQAEGEKPEQKSFDL